MAVNTPHSYPSRSTGEGRVQVTIRVHQGTVSLKGALASDKSLGLSFAQIREAAAAAAAGRERRP